VAKGSQTVNELAQTKLNKRQQIAANLIGLGGRPSDVAEKLSLSKETISRWQSQEAFEVEVDRVTEALLKELLDERVALIDASHRVIAEILLSDDISTSIKGNIAMKYLNAAGAKINAYKVLTEHLSRLNAIKRRRDGDKQVEGLPDVYYDLVNMFK